MTTMEATLVKDLPPSPTGAAQKLYKLSEPYEVKDWNGEVERTIEYLVVSAVSVLGTPETYIFPADENGEVVDWGELPGSFKGGFDHERAIAGFVASGGRWSDDD